MLGLESEAEELRFRLYPSMDSEKLSKFLKRDTLQHLGQRIGLADYRDIQSNFSGQHKDPVGRPVFENLAMDLQQGHLTPSAQQSYQLTPDTPQGISRDLVSAYLRASRWWQHLVGKHRLVLTVYDASERGVFSGIERIETPPAYL